MGTLFRGLSFDGGVVFLYVTEISDLIFIKKKLKQDYFLKPGVPSGVSILTPLFPPRLSALF